MVRMWLVLAFIMATAQGCGIIGGAGETKGFFEDPRAFVAADVEAALKRNERAIPALDPGAPFRADCYRELLAWVKVTGPEATKPDVPVGLVDAYELASQKHAQVSDGGLLAIPEPVKARCRYVEDEIKRAALRGALKIAPFPGAGAAGGLLLR